jgi:hypothetical protein
VTGTPLYVHSRSREERRLARMVWHEALLASSGALPLSSGKVSGPLPCSSRDELTADEVRQHRKDWNRRIMGKQIEEDKLVHGGPVYAGGRGKRGGEREAAREAAPCLTLVGVSLPFLFLPRIEGKP